MRNSVELLGPSARAVEALQQVAHRSPHVQSWEDTAHGVDVVGLGRDGATTAKVRFVVRQADAGSATLEHQGSGRKSAREGYWLVSEDIIERVRAELVQSEVASDPTATGGYLGTLLGGNGLDVEPGRAVVVLFGPTRLSLRFAQASFTFELDDLAEVEAVPTSTAGLDVDAEVLDRAVAHTPMSTVLGVATVPLDGEPAGRQSLIHIGGATTSIVNAELGALRRAMEPAALALLSRPALRRRRSTLKSSPSELVREMSALAQRHYAGELSEREWAEAKAALLGLS